MAGDSCCRHVHADTLTGTQAEDTAGPGQADEALPAPRLKDAMDRVFLKRSCSPGANPVVPQALPATSPHRPCPCPRDSCLQCEKGQRQDPERCLTWALPRPHLPRNHPGWPGLTHRSEPWRWRGSCSPCWP